MTKVRLFCLSLLLLVSCFPIFAASPSSFPVLGPGVKYTCYHIGNNPYLIHVVEIDRSRQDLTFTTALGDGWVLKGLALSKQIASIPASQGTPVAGVNADFFGTSGTYAGITSGLQIMNGELVQTPEYGQQAVWFDATGAPHTAFMTSHLTVTWPNGKSTALALNHSVDTYHYVNLYTPTFYTSTRAAAGNTELVLDPAPGNTSWLPLQAGATIKARIRQINTTGDTALAPGTMVLYIDKSVRSGIQALSAGMDITIKLAITPDVSGITTGIGGYPALLVNGAAPTNWDKSDSIVTAKNPRTAIGWNAKSIFIVALDGRQSTISVGMTVPELSAFMQTKLGCTDAMNFDGGASTELWMNGLIVNSPSGVSERAVANSLVLLRKPVQN